VCHSEMTMLQPNGEASSFVAASAAPANGALTVGQVYAALACYHANTEEIENLLAEENADYDRLCAESSKKPA